MTFTYVHELVLFILVRYILQQKAFSCLDVDPRWLLTTAGDTEKDKNFLFQFGTLLGLL